MTTTCQFFLRSKKQRDGGDMAEKNSLLPLVGAFVAGLATAGLLEFFKTRDAKQHRKDAGATVEGNDLSLFYGDVEELTAITESRKFLPKEVYSKMVLDAVVCCVDCLVVRTSASGKKECLLVERSTEPVKGVWWIPGGRLLKGETFFVAAVRKAKQETGLNDVKPVQVLGVWNTFFPTSHWDTPTVKGTQTVNAIVLVELAEPGANVKLDNTIEQVRWIGLDPEVAERTGEDRYVLEALRRLRAWDPTYNS